VSLLLALITSGGGGYDVTAEAGGYSISGVNALISKSFEIQASAGEYVVNGQSAQIDYASIGTNQKHGGDDAFHHLKHTGWNKKDWQKNHLKEAAIESTIEATYKKILGLEPAPDVIAEIKKEFSTEIQSIDYKQERIFIDWLSKEIAGIKTRMQEHEQDQDDEDAILLLLGY
jgi:hypothetical protein